MKSKVKTPPLGKTGLDGASPDPLYQQLADRLVQAITNGTLVAGQQVPSESELTETYGISRVTVRQALQLLVKSGQLVAKRGKGTFVARTTLQQDLSSLQGFHEALKSQGVEPQTELLNFDATGGLSSKQLPESADLPLLLRRKYSVDGEAFAVVEAFLPSKAAEIGKKLAEKMVVYDILQKYLGVRIGKADVAIECSHPTPQIAKELKLSKNGHVLLMRRTSYSTSGEICEHMRISIVPDRYTFNMSVSGPMQLARAVVPSLST
ncbi:MAG: GntR family transcriptional regulator [Polynucleobacter sp.]|jgi:GntR family transcriptional regulator